MEYVIATIPFMNEVKQMRKAMHKNLISLMKENNTKRLFCGELCDCPIIYDGLTDDEILTLDCINLRGVEGAEYIVFEGSGSFNNGYVTPNSIDIELLVEVYEWVLANKKELF